MKRPSYVLRLLAVAALLAMALVGTAATTFASPPPSGGAGAAWDGSTSPRLEGATETDQSANPADDGAQEVYFASVANGVDFGMGAASTSVTVQNLDVDDAYLFFWVGGSWDLDLTSYLSAGASKTFTAADLGIAEGEDVPVVAALYQSLGSVCTTGDLNGDGDCNDQDVPQAGGGVRDEFLTREAIGAYAAGVAKQAVAGADLPYTTDADTSVSGYNAVSGREVGFFDDLYFPIVQTNCGPGGCWDTNMVVANVGADNNAAVTISFFAADDGSGSLQTGFQIQKLLNQGSSWSVNLSSLVPEGWVGTAHVYTDDAVVAIANRFKAGTDMWVTNTASNAVSESDWQNLGVVTPTGNVPYILFAPDVRTDWNGWNVGINVSNTVNANNHVYIQYAGLNGNAPAGLDRRLAPQGMTYFYNPSDPSEDNCAQPANSTTCEFIGAAVILSEYPVTAAVDGVKYFGDDNNVGQAFSYAATGNLYEFQSAPLIQKGTASTGMGATSGINFLNPNSGATSVEVEWVNPSGYTASNFSNSLVWVPGFATGFVYTMNAGNLPNGFLGSAVVASSLPIAATTANVDYAVSGDGTAIWNLYNPCGFFRQDGDCDLGNVLGPVSLNSLLTVNVTCPTCSSTDDITGTTVSVTGTDVNGYTYTSSAAIDADGTATFAVPAGTFTVTVTAPAGFVASAPQTVSIDANSSATLDFTVAPQAVETGVLAKVLAVPVGSTIVSSEVEFCAGADVPAADCNDPFDGDVVWYGGFDTELTTGMGPIDFDPVLDEITDIDPNYFGIAAAVAYDVPVGQYTICTSVTIDPDADPTTLNNVTWQDICETSSAFQFTYNDVDGIGFTGGDTPEPIMVNADTVTIVVNFAAALDVFVQDASTPTVGIPGAQVCVYNDPGMTEQVACAVTGTDGMAHVFGITSGVYTVNATANGYDSVGTTFQYSLFGEGVTGVTTIVDSDLNGLLDIAPADADTTISLTTAP